MINKIKARYDNGENLPLFYFWRHYTSKHGLTNSCLSQWWELHPFTVANKTFATTEHFMMYSKAILFKDYNIANEILKNNSPHDAKKYGRKVKGFDSYVWDKVKYKIVVVGNYHKFIQHADLKSFLVGTGSNILVEASPYDRIWGVGMNASDRNITSPHKWKGDNLLGFALMEVRNHIINNTKPK